MLNREQIIAWNDQVIAADPEGDGDFELVFAAPDVVDDVAQLEALIGAPLPADLRALYLQVGAFKHVHYALAWQTLRIESVSTQLHWLTRPENRAFSRPYSLGLVAAIHAAWGEREEFNDALEAEAEQLVNANYVVFGSRHIDDNVIDYWYFDRQGLFGNFRFDQDEAAYNVGRIEQLADILPRANADLSPAERRAYVLAEAESYGTEDTFPRYTLNQLLRAQFDAITLHLAEQ
ncbi:hypothetical protein [Deinococcus maricopensis]|uniref:SMI1/KNR4 family protein n=1 Tax=Deinococcus maricopensis (strain DSM 21211 / LMG 22137 / NRRL B-23946 / LB-34) TaxID=709986 RepID=E8U3C1_DEIML|nr:hypothetical protein [Deinococcus maricopensis]ADV65792.1 hypothetical protein Deima_0128 [Deinococcus maricopensis DSM 21211]